MFFAMVDEDCMRNSNLRRFLSHPSSWELPMSIATARVLRRDPATIEPWAETCGQIRCLVEQKDGAAAEVHHVEISDAKLHYHERTDEFYYVIDGQGTMTLDDEEVELHKGVVIYIPRGVRHKARGNLTILTVCIPAGVLNDIHELE
jgi:mannose-6-phosphate isomerase-like protein (cupin superfamily)